MSSFEPLFQMENRSAELDLRNYTSRKCSHCLIDLESKDSCCKTLSEVLNFNSGTDNHIENITLTLYEALMQIGSIRLLLPGHGQVLRSSSSSYDFLSRNYNDMCVCPNCEHLILQVFISVQNLKRGNGNSLLIKLCPEEDDSSEILRKDEKIQTDLDFEETESPMEISFNTPPIGWTALNIKEEMNFNPTGEVNYFVDNWSQPQSGQNEEPIASGFQLQRYWEDLPNAFKDQSPSPTKYSSKNTSRSTTLENMNTRDFTGNRRKQPNLESNFTVATIISPPPKKPRVMSKDELFQKFRKDEDRFPYVQLAKLIVHYSEGQSSLTPDELEDLNSDPSFGVPHSSFDQSSTSTTSSRNKPKRERKKVIWPCSKSGCQNKFLQRSDLEDHLMDCHMTAEEREIMTARLNLIPKGSRQCLCFEPGCSFTTCNPITLRAHRITTHTPDEAEKQALIDLWYTRICPEPDCGKRFETPFELRIHKNTHLRTKIRDELGYSFTVNPEMDDEHNHLCSECGMGFISKKSLYDHKRNHVVDRKFKCETCGKLFKLRHGLLRHRLLVHHTTIRPFSCDICGKAFKSSANLNYHGHVHKDSWDFECPAPKCEAAFKRKHSLLRHLINQHGLQKHHIKKWFKNPTAVRLFEEDT